jgi:histidinol dehydrogenase
MKIIDLTKKKNGETCLSALFERRAYPPDIEENVKKILTEVKSKGDAALANFAKIYDGVKMSPSDFRITEKEMSQACRKIPSSLKKHIEFAVDNVREFARRKIPKNWKFSPRKGVVLGEKFSPLKRIGVYVPGGTAPLISTAVHTAAIAKIAGVKEIVAITPPSKRGIHPALLFAMKSAGVTDAYRLGGVYGIGALAYGTDTVKKVEKIVGPGNAYVTAAKKMVYGDVAIDMIAGPSEIMIIADSSANPDFIAADLLSQAEHGSGNEQAVLLSTDRDLVEKVEKLILLLSKKIKSSKALENVIEKNTFLVVASDLLTAAKIAGEYAPEHLEIMCRNPETIASKISSAGAIFIGQWAPESVGDYVAGPSHVLPTGGTAKFFSGLSVEQFFHRTSLIKYDEEALRKESGAILAMAETEGLSAHALSVALRV